MRRKNIFLSIFLSAIIMLVCFISRQAFAVAGDKGGDNMTDNTLAGGFSIELEGAEFKYDSRYTEFAVNAPGDADSVKVRIVAGNGGSDTYLINGETAKVNEWIQVGISKGYNLIKITVNETNKNIRLIIRKTQTEDVLYSETYRPLLHNSTQINLMNDPNGLVYNEETGEYHLFYQQDTALGALEGSKDSTESKCWAHSVSKDLIHWRDLPLAIMFDDYGEIYSGSAVIDRNNTSGLFDDTTPPGARMVILYTYYSGHFGNQKYGTQMQGLAYSLDNGLTWIKYKNNPVMPNGDNYSEKYGGGFRDPKVIWYSDESLENGGIWMAVIAAEPVRMFTSPDLLNWTFNKNVTFEGEKSPIKSECPDLIHMPIYDSEGNKTGQYKWVFMGSDFNNGDSSIFYVTGDVYKDDRGRYRFEGDTKEMSVSINCNNEVYAGQTFFNDPKGRTISISWIRDWIMYDNTDTLSKYDFKNWLGTHTLPIELRLVKIGDELVMKKLPVEEIALLRDDRLLSIENTKFNSGDADILSGLTPKLYDIQAEFTLGTARTFGFTLRQGENEETLVYYNSETKSITVDRNSAGMFIKGIYNAPVNVGSDNKLKLRIVVDTSIIEVYAGDGDSMVSTQIYPQSSSTGMSFYAANGDVAIDKLEVYELHSIWSYEPEQDDPNKEEDRPSTNKKGKSMTLPLIGIISLLALVLIGAVIYVKRIK